MRKLQFVAPLAALVTFALDTIPVRADFHLFFIKEIFSNHDGSVQFIELFTTSSGQQNLHPNHSIVSSTQSFPFPTDSPTPTNNRHLLLATAGFDALVGGALPDYLIPSNFFNPAGDTITFGEGVSVHTFSEMPTDGVNSLNYTGFFGSATVATNTPRNHAGAGGTVNIPPPPVTTGDYNGDLTVDAADYTVWRDTLGQAVATNGDGADGDADGTINPGDYEF